MTVPHPSHQRPPWSPQLSQATSVSSQECSHSEGGIFTERAAAGLNRLTVRTTRLSFAERLPADGNADIIDVHPPTGPLLLFFSGPAFLPHVPYDDHTGALLHGLDNVLSHSAERGAVPERHILVFPVPGGGLSSPYRDDRELGDCRPALSKPQLGVACQTALQCYLRTYFRVP